MVALDVLDDLLRLELQAVAHKVLTEQRDIILQTLLHLNILFMMLKSETLCCILMPPACLTLRSEWRYPMLSSRVRSRLVSGCTV